MTDREDTETALAYVLKALKAQEADPNFYDADELAEIVAERDDLERKLLQMEPEHADV